MKVKLVDGKSPIGQTIRAVAQAQSSRLFKSEVNTDERSAFVFLIIRSEVALALYDLGVPIHQIVHEIDPTEDVLAQMVKDGYKFGTDQLIEGVSLA